jgi:predicted acylesterase/phospholipase RssA
VAPRAPESGSPTAAKGPDGESAAAERHLEVEEVRLALALNGGVSLAIWMGGCAVELDCARRAGWGKEDLGPDSAEAGGAERKLYNALCEVLKRELVIDIMSGASAGGVNGGLLAAAMVSGRRLHPDYVRDRWLELGDFSRLLHRSTDPTPRSLMQGELFTEGLLEVFDELTAHESARGRPELEIPGSQSRPPADSTPHLDVTVTDVRGTERGYRDVWGGTFSAREYRRRFSFRERGDYTAQNLAAAARCSASFPAAFEPFRPNEESWRLTERSGAETSTEGPSWTIDGGLLDNAPIRAAIELIPTRPAQRQVKRYLVYVNPEPHEPLDPGVAGIGSDADGRNPSQGPELFDVAGYVINLPRKTPVADQLEAIEDAVQSSSLVSTGAIPLLAASIDTVSEAATALLSPYRSRRSLRSLKDLLDDSDAAERAYHALMEAEVDLPWIPRSIDFSGDPFRWSWGISAAIRFCHFLLDLIRFWVERNPDHEAKKAAPFFEARKALNQPLGELQSAYAGVFSNQALIGELRSPDSRLSPREKVAGLQGLAGDDSSVALTAVRSSIRIFAKLLADLGDTLELESPSAGEGEVEVGRALFGEGWTKDAAFGKVRGSNEPISVDDPLTGPERHCLRRVLSIEVIRRAYAVDDVVDSAQQLYFVQITPDAPSPILLPDPPDGGRRSAEDKLAGIRLGHFAGFLKRSWRANDFMWGRLDAAARIVDLLVDQARAVNLGVEEVAYGLAARLLPSDAGRLQRSLIGEALDRRDDGAAPSGSGDAPSADRLRERLAPALVEDLSGGPDAELTREVCTCAAQLEILRAELPKIAEATRGDAAEGSSTLPLDLGKADGRTGELPEGALGRAIADLRRGEPLPLRLGRDDPAELTSDLTARTASHAGFVTLAALRTAKLPGARALDLLRPPLLAVTGMSARGVWLRVPLILGFWAAALYLTSRVVDTPPDQTANLATVLSRQVLLALVAALAVVGVAVLPLVRGLRRRWEPVSFAELAGALLLVLVGGGVAVALALLFGDDLTPAKLIAATGFDPPPPDWVMDLALAVALGYSLTRTALLRKLPSALVDLTKRGVVSAALLAVVAALVSFWTFKDLVGVIGEGPAWRTISAFTALILPPLVCLAYLLLHNVVKRSTLPVRSIVREGHSEDDGGPR